MSSIVGHAAVGAAIYLARAKIRDRRAVLALPVLVFLAIAPDLDYPLAWFFHVHTAVRWTHSIVFCLAVAAAAWLLTSRQRVTMAWPFGFVAFSIASCSHLALDLLVGVHPVPVFWPLPHPNLSSPIAVLPSAGHLRFDNYYLWRNLLIECGVLFPVLFVGVAVSRSMPARALLPKLLLAAALWLPFLFWSIDIHQKFRSPIRRTPTTISLASPIALAGPHGAQIALPIQLAPPAANPCLLAQTRQGKQAGGAGGRRQPN